MADQAPDNGKPAAAKTKRTRRPQHLVIQAREGKFWRDVDGEAIGWNTVEGAIGHMKRTKMVGTYRIISVKREVTIAVETVEKVNVTIGGGDG